MAEHHVIKSPSNLPIASEKATTKFTSLPSELVQDIAELAGVNAACALRLTCKRFGAVVEPVLYRLVKEHYSFYGDQAYGEFAAAHPNHYPRGPMVINDGLSRLLYRDDAIIIGRLLDIGMSPDSYNCEGDPLLYLASYNADHAVFDLLLERNVNVDCRSYRTDRTPLSAVAEIGDNYKIEKLLQKGARDISPFATLRMLQNCSNETAEAVIEANFDLEVSDPYNGNSVFHAAAKNRSHNIIPTLARHFHGEHVSDRNWYGETALWVAMESQNPRALKSLLDAGINIHITDNEGKTALHVAARLSFAGMIRALLERGADPNARMMDDCTPFHCLIIGNAFSIRQLTAGQQLELASNSVQSLVIPCPMEIGAQILIDHGVDLKARDVDGASAFDYTRSYFASRLWDCVTLPCESKS